MELWRNDFWKFYWFGIFNGQQQTYELIAYPMQICNAVAVAKIMNATLILPVLKQDQIWKDQTWDFLPSNLMHTVDFLHMIVLTIVT